jgi:hypothetical protein
LLFVVANLCNEALELAVVVLPFFGWGHGFYGVPVLHELAIINSVQVVKSRMHTAPAPLTDCQSKVPLGQHSVERAVHNAAGT